MARRSNRMSKMRLIAKLRSARRSANNLRKKQKRNKKMLFLGLVGGVSALAFSGKLKGMMSKK